MKTYIIALLSLCFFVNNAIAQPKPPKPPKLATAYIRTSAMCPTCKTTIENNMNVVKGVQIATLNLDSNTLQVQYKTAKTNPDKLRKALTNIGYDADGLPSNPRAYNALMQCCKKEYGRHDN